MKIYHRLRTKLVSTFFVITLVPALIIGIYAIHVSSQTLLKQALATQTAHIDVLQNNLTSFLSTVKGDLLFLSQSPMMKDYLSFHRIVSQGSKLNSEVLTAPDTLQTMSPEAFLEQKREALEQEFLALTRNRQIYYQIRYLDKTGQEIVRVDSLRFVDKIIARDQLQDKSERYYFNETIRLQSKQVFVSPLDLNRERGKIETPHKPVIRYAINVYDDKNHKAGIVILNIDANQFLKPLVNASLVTQDGYFASHPDYKKCWGAPSDLNTGHNLEQEYPQLAQQIRDIDSGTMSTEAVTLSFQHVPVPGSGKNWILIVQRDTAELFNSVTEFRITFIAILVVSLTIALLLALLLSAKITRPLEYLTEKVDTISKGELTDNPIKINDKGEIGQLAKAFERMRVSMIKSFDRLRR